jgi:YHS domain-containing protein
MKKILFILSIISAATGCNQSKAPVPEKKMETMTVKKDSTAADFSKLNFAYRYDYSCGMPVSAGVSDTTTYKGKLYGFCSPECKADFLSKPEEYISKK